MQIQLEELEEERSKTKEGRKSKKFKTLSAKIANLKRDINMLPVSSPNTNSDKLDSSDASSKRTSKGAAEEVSPVKSEGRKTMNSQSATVSFNDIMENCSSKEAKSLIGKCIFKQINGW